MTAGTKKSVNITNLETLPIALLDKKIGREKVMIDTVTVATTNIDDIGDIILFGPLPSNAVVTSIVLYNTALDTHSTPTLAADMFVYYSGQDNGVGNTSGTVIGTTKIASAITSLQGAVTLGSQIRFEDISITTLGDELWKNGGLTADCGGTLYLGLKMTAAAATAAAGTISIVVKYL